MNLIYACLLTVFAHEPISVHADVTQHLEPRQDADRRRPRWAHAAKMRVAHQVNTLLVFSYNNSKPKLKDVQWLTTHVIPKMTEM